MIVNKIIPISECKRGYILKGIKNHRRRGHFIIFYDHIDGFDFQGAMITSKDYNNQNIALAEEHFFNKNTEGIDYSVVYKNSFLVKSKLHKFHEMGEFIFVGLLTKKGISYLENIIDHLELISWEQHCARINLI